MNGEQLTVTTVTAKMINTAKTNEIKDENT